MKSIVDKLTRQKSINFDFNRNKIKEVNSEERAFVTSGIF